MSTVVTEKHFGPVWFLPGPQKGKYPACHSVYIEGAKVLIDPASDRERLKQLRDAPGVKTVILSHWHEDHFLHLDLFDDVPLWTSAADAGPLSDIDLFLDAYGIEGEQRDFAGKFFVEHFKFKPRKTTRILSDGELFPWAEVTMQVLHTPGHTPGHLTFYFKELELLFLGDYDLTPFGPWYGDAYSSIEETISSNNLLQKMPAEIWLTSHGQGIFEQNPRNEWLQYLDMIEKREAKLLKLLDEPKTLSEIAAAWIVYGEPKEPQNFYLFGERAIMQKHLERLACKGIIAKKGHQFIKLA
ncbi:MBL fold metallo-hydrolase [candidate division CSSED10-310 bacterium]|uniref:MBL fold metallo-hydrolase n=1 Tax=candidate division CSSED10-310 bacterium TaxID=2855610 RepID=A0ABV6Z335_UNCC1